jgi:hypothetical protein
MHISKLTCSPGAVFCWILGWLALGLALSTGPCSAWEISVDAEVEHRYRYYGRAGAYDLFGIASLQDSNKFEDGYIASKNPCLPEEYFIGFAGPSCYGTGWTATIPANTATAAGWRITRGGYSHNGSDFTISQSRITMTTTIKPVSAIRLGFVYNLGGNRNRFTEYDDPGLVNAIHQQVANGTPIVGGHPTTCLTLANPRVKDGVGTPPYSRYFTHESSWQPRHDKRLDNYNAMIPPPPGPPPSGGIQAADGAANDNFGANVTTALGAIEGFEGAVDLPWGQVSLGAKSFIWGTGATFGPNTQIETLAIQVPYGPFRLTWQIWPGHGVGQLAPAVPTNPLPVEVTRPQLLQFWDIIYRNNYVDAGIATYWQRSHLQRQALDWAGFPPEASALDQNILFNTVYGKLWTGSFLMATEYSWFMADNYFRGAAPYFQEGYHWFGEIGLVTGPARVSAMFAIASGRVLNNPNRTKRYEPFPINSQCMAPYESLMFHAFGGGNQVFGGFFMPSDGDGMLADGHAFGARFDYAVATNLNIWVSYMKAQRLERAGNYIGAINETDSATVSGTELYPGPDLAYFVAVGPPPSGLQFFGNQNKFPERSPYVDNDEIGWEINVGLDWQLLEGHLLRLHYARWQPGHWYDWAYQAITLRGRGSEAVRDGVLTTRSLIQSFEFNLESTF